MPIVGAVSVIPVPGQRIEIGVLTVTRREAVRALAAVPGEIVVGPGRAGAARVFPLRFGGEIEVQASSGPDPVDEGVASRCCLPRWGDRRPNTAADGIPTDRLDRTLVAFVLARVGPRHPLVLLLRDLEDTHVVVLSQCDVVLALTVVPSRLVLR